MAQTQDGTMARKREMESELCKLSAEEKELKRQMESLEHLSPAVQGRQKERVRRGKGTNVILLLKTNEMNPFVIVSGSCVVCHFSHAGN